MPAKPSAPSGSTQERVLCRVLDRDGEPVEEVHDGKDFVDLTAPADRTAIAKKLAAPVVHETTPLAQAGGRAKAGSIGVRIWVDGDRQEPSAALVAAAASWLVGVAVGHALEELRVPLRTELATAVDGALAASDADTLVVVRLSAVKGYVVGAPYPKDSGHRGDLVVALGQDRYWLSTQGVQFSRTVSKAQRLGIKPGGPATLSLRGVAERLERSADALEVPIRAADLAVSHDIRSDGAMAVKARLLDIGAPMTDRAQLSAETATLQRQLRRLDSCPPVVAPVDEAVIRRIEAVAQQLEAARTRLTDLQQAVLATATYEQSEQTRGLQTTVTLATGVLVVPALLAGIFGANVKPLSPDSHVSVVPFLLFLIAASCGALTLLLGLSGDGGDGGGHRTRWRHLPASILVAGSVALLAVAVLSIDVGSRTGYEMAQFSWWGTALIVVAVWAIRGARARQSAGTAA